MKKILTLTTKSLLVVVLLLVSGYLQAQVTVGDGAPPQKYSILEVVSGGIGGLRMPHLTTVQRDALKENDGSNFEKDPSRTTPFLYEGLSIYNTDTRCVEYYNAKQWISMCSGSQNFVTTCDDTPIAPAGGTKECGVTDPNCELSGEYKFEIVSGADYANLTVTDAGQGKFKLEFSPNDWASSRTAIIMVISPCGNSNMFVYTQDGDASGCGTSPAFTISSDNGTNLCATGAAYLHLTGTGVDSGTYIWTLNGKQVGRGLHYVATQSGKYVVYGDKIGCPNSQSIVVSIDGGNALPPVPIIVKGNNGLVCGPTGTARLIAKKPATGTVRWFKDGILQSEGNPDNEIDATVGDWFAVVTDPSGCWSLPSETTIVSVDPSTGTQLTTPVIVKPATFCAGSTVQLSISDLSYNPSYTYTWYENNTLIGTGKYLMYNVPQGLGSVVIRSRATGSGCSAEAIGVETITAGTIPSRPVITGNTVLCSGQATLNVLPTSAGTFTYAWYKNNELIGTSQSLNVTSGGDYYATVTDGCTSPQARITIDPMSSAIPTVTLNRSSESPNQNDLVTYAASINFTPATGYQWILSNATMESGGGNTANAVVKFGTTGAASVKVVVSNACGSGEAIHTVASVSPACADPVSVSVQSSLDKTTFFGTSVTLGAVSAVFDSGTPATKYEWYRSTTVPATTDGSHTLVGGNTNTLITDQTLPVGTYYYYCMVSNNSCASSKESTGVFTVAVYPNPENMPAGSGTFSGNTCFDINKSNHSGDCGTEVARSSQMVDFATLGSVSYTFTSSSTGTVSNIRFMVVDSENCVDTYITSGATSGNNKVATLSINFKPTLSQENSIPKIWGRTRAQAAKVKLFAVYNDGTKDVAVPLTVNIQDCVCCGAYIGPGAWKAFMCHNLGANTALDPYIPAAGLHGAKYKFGAKVASASMAEDQAGGSIVGWASRPYQTSGDWDMVNSNPCPSGWRVPTFLEWQGVSNSTLNPQTVPAGATWTNSPTNYTSGRLIGTAMFLPAAGVRINNGDLSFHGETGYYWSSNTDSYLGKMMFLNRSSVIPASQGYDRFLGMSVRCIAE